VLEGLGGLRGRQLALACNSGSRSWRGREGAWHYSRCGVIWGGVQATIAARLIHVYVAALWHPAEELLLLPAPYTSSSVVAPLHMLQVPKSKEALVLEMEVDWTAVNDPAVPLSSISQPRLCLSTSAVCTKHLMTAASHRLTGIEILLQS
jgi:hypothetical protein